MSSNSISRSVLRRKATLVVMIALCVGGLTSCRAAYVARLAWEQLFYLVDSQPIDDLLQDPSLDERSRQQLQLVVDIRRFASANHLDPEGSFADLADPDRAVSFHVVTAAYADRLVPYTWWYPVIGRVPYRGYFDPDRADGYANELREQLLDVRIVRASAYSSLGWFDDPLPAGLLFDSRAQLASVILHELVHQHYFLPGHVAFNETLANSLGYRMAERFFSERGEVEQAAEVEEFYERWLARSIILDQLGEALKVYFRSADADSLDFAEMMAGRAKIYEAWRAELKAVGIGGGTASVGINDNASFLAVWRYAMRAALIDSFVERNGGDATALEALASVTAGSSDPYAAITVSRPGG